MSNKKGKDKPAGKKTMQDYIHENKEQQIPIIQNPNNVILPSHGTVQNLEKLQEEHGDYNNTITELDKRYTSIKPTRSILVRVFAKMPAMIVTGKHY